MIAEGLTHASFADDIDFNTEHFFEIYDEAAVIEQGTIGLEADNKIDVRFVGNVPACDRAKEADVAGTVTFGNGDDLIAPIENVVLGDDRCILLVPCP